jgi:serine/threonine protein kinase
VAKIGQVIGGRYRLLELRSEDEVSAIFRARDSQANREVAIRVLSPEVASDPDLVAEFRLAMRTAAGFSHPNVLALYDYGVSDGDVYAVTELMEGQELGALLRRNGPVPPRRAASVTAVVARAVAAAHERGLIHAGIRSGRILVGRDGQIKLADFGLARVLGESGLPLPIGVEEASYQSPEQARRRRATDASDVYALGVLLFELLTGRLPWDGGTAADIAAARHADPVPSPAEFQDGIPNDIVAIDRQAMATDPGRRFESAADMADTLDAAVEAQDQRAATQPEAEPEPEAAPSVSRYARPAPPAAPPSPAAFPPPAPVAPPVVPVLRRPNPTARVDFPADAYATAAPPAEPVPSSAAEPRSRSYATEGTAARPPRRINPGDSAPEPPDDEEQASVWAWVAGFLALFLVTLLFLTIYLLLTRNSPSRSVVYAPDLTNLTYSVAQQTAHSYGLQVAVQATRPNDGSVPDTTIVDQTPAAGSSMNRGDTIYVTVLTGTSEVVVPNLINLQEPDAVNSLTSAGLQVGNRTEAFDPNVPEGQIVSTNPRAGLSVLKDSKVDYVVSDPDTDSHPHAHPDSDPDTDPHPHADANRGSHSDAQPVRLSHPLPADTGGGSGPATGAWHGARIGPGVPPRHRSSGGGQLHRRRDLAAVCGSDQHRRDPDPGRRAGDRDLPGGGPGPIGGDLGRDD